MKGFSDILSAVDTFVWGPVMLVLLVGTGIFLTIRLRFRTWRNLGYASGSWSCYNKRTYGGAECNHFNLCGDAAVTRSCHAR